MTSYPPPPTGAQPPAPYGAPAPPPAAPDTSQAVKAPAVAWLVPIAALFALIGMFVPWFKAKATLTGGGPDHPPHLRRALLVQGRQARPAGPDPARHPGHRRRRTARGKAPARFSRGGGHPVASAGKASLIVGAVSLVCVVIAWFLVKSQYKFKDGGTSYSWDNYIKAAKDAGFKLELSRGPQVGYFLTIVAAVLAIVAGVLMILAARRASGAGAPSAYPPPG